MYVYVDNLASNLKEYVDAVNVYQIVGENSKVAFDSSTHSVKKRYAILHDYKLYRCVVYAFADTLDELKKDVMEKLEKEGTRGFRKPQRHSHGPVTFHAKQFFLLEENTDTKTEMVSKLSDKRKADNDRSAAIAKKFKGNTEAISITSTKAKVISKKKKGNATERDGKLAKTANVMNSKKIFGLFKESQEKKVKQIAVNAALKEVEPFNVREKSESSTKDSGEVSGRIDKEITKVKPDEQNEIGQEDGAKSVESEMDDKEREKEKGEDKEKGNEGVDKEDENSEVDTDGEKHEEDDDESDDESDDEDDDKEDFKGGSDKRKDVMIDDKKSKIADTSFEEISKSCKDPTCRMEKQVLLREAEQYFKRCQKLEKTFVDKQAEMAKDLEEIKGLLKKQGLSASARIQPCKLKELSNVTSEPNVKTSEDKVYIGNGKYLRKVDIASLDNLNGLRPRMVGLAKLFWPDGEHLTYSFRPSGSRTKRISDEDVQSMIGILSALKWSKAVPLDFDHIKRELGKALSAEDAASTAAAAAKRAAEAKAAAKEADEEAETSS